MEFSGGEMFGEGVVLARRYLGEGKWRVWDMRKDSAKNCEACSSDAERLGQPAHACPFKGVFLVCFVILRVLSLPSATTAAPPKKGCSEAEVEGVSAGRP